MSPWAEADNDRRPRSIRARSHRVRPRVRTSAVCGPTLDKVKPFVDEFPDLTFINVEPYELEWDGSQLQPVLTDGQLTPVPAVDEWGLLTEPWIFVVDAGGAIRGSFEGAVGDSELRAALEAVRFG